MVVRDVERTEVIGHVDERSKPAFDAARIPVALRGDVPVVIARFQKRPHFAAASAAADPCCRLGAHWFCPEHSRIPYPGRASSPHAYRESMVRPLGSAAT